MKRKTCKILTFFVLITLIMNIQLEVFADPPSSTYNVKKTYTTGIDENSICCIEWAGYKGDKNITVNIRSENGFKKYADNPYELERIDYSGDIYVGEKLSVWFELNRGEKTEEKDKNAFIIITDAREVYGLGFKKD